MTLAPQTTSGQYAASGQSDYRPLTTDHSSPRPGARFLDRDGRRIVIVYVQEERGLIFIKFTSNGCPALMLLSLYRQFAQLMNFVPLAPEAA